MTSSRQAEQPARSAAAFHKWSLVKHVAARRATCGIHGWVIRSCSQDSTPLSAVLAIAVGWPVKPWGEWG
jgi:hypothetical protein